MLAWMRFFGDLRRVGVESTGSYGAGLSLVARGRRMRRQAGVWSMPSNWPYGGALYITLESVSQLSDDPPIDLPPVAR